MPVQHSHCSYCGAGYPPDAPWPRRCAGCGEITWRNPLPVGVALLPVLSASGTGLVVVRRGIEPGLGELALPGGFLELGETWQQGVVRELREETGILADAAHVTLVDVVSISRSILIFGLLPPVDRAALPPMRACEEVSEWLVLDRPVPLAFDTHTAVAAGYFASA
jgi:ADP-ribose pyrophosphatase YjhB (NUDIX family)